jgi:hypothetical protein
MAIKLFRGDDTNFADLREIAVTLNTSFSLAGYSAIFTLQSFRRVYDDISSGSFTIAFGGRDTSRMSAGTDYGSLVLVDPSGRSKTLTNLIEFDITDTVETVIDDETLTFDVTIDEETVNISVGSISGAVPLGSEVYSVTGHNTLKTLDLSTCSFAELCDLVGTLVETMQTSGIIQ